MPAPPGKRVPGLKCVVRVVRVSGTIRKAEEELLRRSRKSVAMAKLAQSTHHPATLNETVPTKDRDMLMPVADLQFDDGSIVDDDEESSGGE